MTGVSGPLVELRTERLLLRRWRPADEWRLARRSWGRGLATEAALAVRDHAFATLDLPELISVIHPENERSRRVAEKLGMVREGQAWQASLRRRVHVWALPAP